MLKLSHLRFPALIVLCMFTLSTAASWQNSLPIAAGVDARVDVIERGTNGLNIALEFPSISSSTLANISENELKELSEFTRWIAIPSGYDASLNITEQTVRPWSIQPGYAQPGNALSLKKQNNLPPAASLGKPQYLRGRKIAPITIKPLQQTNADQMLETCELNLEIQFTPSQNHHPVWQAPLSANYQNALNEVLINPNRDQPMTNRSRMMILYPQAYQDQEGINAINNFALWKRLTGIITEVHPINLNNNSPEDIKDMLREAYLDNDAPLEYLIIIGYDEIIFGSEDENLEEEEELYFPTYEWEFDRDPVVGDMYYVTFDDEEDLVADAFYGRYLVPNTEALIGALRRTIIYENSVFRGPQNREGEWFTAALISSDKDSVPSYAAYDIFRWGSRKLQEYGFDRIDTVAWVDYNSAIAPTSEFFETGVSVAVGDGWLLGAVDPFRPDNPDAFAHNDGMNPLVVTNLIHYGLPVTARWFHKVTPEDIHGPIAVYGFAGRGLLDTYLIYINNMIGSTIWQIRHSDAHHAGKMHLTANLDALQAMMRIEDDLYVFQFMGISRFLGDPSVSIYTVDPPRLQADLPQTIPVGTTGFQLNLNDGQNAISDVDVVIHQQDNVMLTTNSTPNGFAAFVIEQGLAEGVLRVVALKDNYRPLYREIEVVVPQIILILDEVDVEQDDLVNGGEAQLNLTIANVGGANARNITAHFATNSPYLSFSRDQAGVDDIDSDETGELTDDVNLIISSDCPGGQTLPVIITLTIGQEEWTLGFELTSIGPVLSLGQVETQNIAPGNLAQLLPQLQNIGNGQINTITAQLTTEHPLINVVEAEQNYDDLNPDDARFPNNPFTFNIDESFIPGQSIPFELLISSEDGFQTTLNYRLTVGEAEVTDPLGPDQYGYVCYDNGDVSYYHAPTYHWIEINGDRQDAQFNGEKIYLRDNFGDQWNETALLELPFAFQYYGQEFDSLTICSNGWLSFGTTESSARFAPSRQIPGAFAPEGQLSVFWQNFRNQQFTYNGLFYYHDQVGGRFIIEWSGVQVSRGDEIFDLHFQVILYDQERYPTPTGDGEIVMQYKAITIVPGQEYAHQFPVVGIRSPDGLDGIQYTYWDEYPPQARALQDELAIKFTTWIRNEFGAVRGRIVNADNPDQPVEDATIDPHTVPPVTSNEQGLFEILGLRPGIYENVRISAKYFSDVIISFEIEDNSVTDLGDIHLPVPQPYLYEEHQNLQKSLRPDGSRTEAIVRLMNNGSGELIYNTVVRDFEGASATFDTVQVIHLNPLINNDLQCEGPAMVGDLVYIPGIVTGQPNAEIFVFNTQGELVRRFLQPVPQNQEPAIRLKNLSWDGQHIWAAYRHQGEKWLFSFTPDGDRRAIVELALIPGMGDNLVVAARPETGTIFVTDRDEDIYEMNRDHEVVSVIPIHFPGRAAKITSMLWNPLDPDGMPLYILDTHSPQNELDANPNLYKINPKTGEMRYIQTLPIGSASPRYYGGFALWQQPGGNAKLGLIEKFGLQRNTRVFLKWHDMGADLSMMLPNSFQNRSGVIPPNEATYVGFEVDVTNWEEGIYRWSYLIYHNAIGDSILIPVTLEVDDESSIPNDNSELPEGFTLKSVYPNPFNNAIRLDYTLDHSGEVKFFAYDINGRLASSSVINNSTPGQHSFIWNANNLPSGIYLVQLESAGIVRSAKVVLMR